MWNGHTEAAIVRAAVCVQERLQVVNQQWQVHAVNACRSHGSVVELWAAAVRHRVTYHSIHLRIGQTVNHSGAMEIGQIVNQVVLVQWKTSASKGRHKLGADGDASRRDGSLLAVSAEQTLSSDLGWTASTVQVLDCLKTETMCRAASHELTGQQQVVEVLE